MTKVVSVPRHMCQEGLLVGEVGCGPESGGAPKWAHSERSQVPPIVLGGSA